MNTEQIEAAIRYYEEDNKYRYNKHFHDAAISALREKQERENPKPQSGVKGIWIEEDDDEIEITVRRRDKPVRICVGTGDVVIVEKLYGPAVLEDLRIECTYHGWKVSGDDVITEIGELALEALREKTKREKGCEHCDDDCCPRLNWHYGLDHILPGYKYCPMCGRKLQEAHK
jgi:hypothetical protein